MSIQSDFLPAFVQLGKVLKLASASKPWPGFSCGLNEEEYTSLVKLTKEVYVYNNWFTEENVKKCFAGLALIMDENTLINWLVKYQFNQLESPKTVALIMAGNIPLVGFHDFLCVIFSGNKALIKLSSSDTVLLPALTKLLIKFNPEIEHRVEFSTGRLANFDAVIATGSNNSARYFDYYFGKYPHIIRKNRNSVAVISNQTTDGALAALGEDIFAYFGLGCRNVSMLYIEKGFDLNRFISAIFPYNEAINNKKYGNNYDYNRALYLLNKIPFLDNGFVLFREDSSLVSPVGVIHYQYYENTQDLERLLSQQSEQIQCVVGEDYIPFGGAQYPSVDDYADGVDTMRFLTELSGSV
ncbi:MAG: acyl-CoA reductase [Flavobacteriales bacterium]